MESGTTGPIHGLVKETKFCVNFVDMWWQNGSFETPQTFCFEIGLCSNHIWSWILGGDWKSAFSFPSTSGREGIFCDEFKVWHVAKKCKKLGNSQSSECRATSPNGEISATLVRPCDQNVPARLLRKVLLATVHPRECGPEVDQRPGGVVTSPAWLGTSWCGANLAIWICWKSSPLRAAAPVTLPRGKAGMEMNEENILQPIKFRRWMCPIFMSFLDEPLWLVRLCDNSGCSC